MPKIIKQEIKRSMPLFVILCLILTTTAVGLIFNFDVRFIQLKDKNLDLELSQFEAQADFATTTVEVLNAPPAFTVYPAEYNSAIYNFSG